MNKLAAYHFRGRASVPSQRWGDQGRSRRGPRLRLLDLMRDALGEQARKAVSEALTNDPLFEFEPGKGYGRNGLAADRGLRLAGIATASPRTSDSLHGFAIARPCWLSSSEAALRAAPNH